MRIIFIRHSEPDYSIDSLTEKGVREAAALNKRILTWDDDIDYFCSPLGRAELTADIALSGTGKEAESLSWLREFDIYVKDPDTGSRRIPWDFMPSYWTADENLLSYDNWFEAEIMRSGDVKKEYTKLIYEFDSLLSRYGYERNGKTYKVKEHSEKTIVLFCHMGVSFMLMGHMLNISPVSLIHGMCMLPSSISVFQTEERQQGTASFRATAISDISHLKDAGEPLSEMGYFAKVFTK